MFCHWHQVCIRVNGKLVLSDTTCTLRNTWEETSFQLERLQANPECVLSEQKLLQSRLAPKYLISFDPECIMSHAPQTPIAGRFALFSLAVTSPWSPCKNC